MRRFAASDCCLRFKKPVAIALIVFVIVALLHSWAVLDSSFAAYSRARLPKLPAWLASSSSWTTGLKSDAKLDGPDSFQARQRLGSDINSLFAEFRPLSIALNQSFLDRWPTMPLFELAKKYDYNQVAAASANFFLDDANCELFKKQQQAMMQAVPAWETVSRAYSGRGVVISAGAKPLERIWPNTVLMLRSLNSSLPIEVWTKDQEEYDRTLPLVDQMQAELGLAISVHTLADYMSIVWKVMPLSEIFKVKALALLFSSFEEVVLFDSDSVPVMDPMILFDLEEAESGLIQWPDFWTNSVSKVLHEAYNIDYKMTRTCESGQVMLNKKKQFEPLVMASYFNWWGPDFFYMLMNLDGMGAGDKDTFWMGSAAYHRGYHVVERDLELITAKKADGSPWKKEQNILNGAMGQFNPSNTSEIFSMHLHAPKINMQAAELSGQFDIQFFRPEKEQNVAFAKGEAWLETRLWENLQWMECESVLRNLTTNACEGIKERVLLLRNLNA